MTGLLQDVRYALRGMVKARGLTLVAVVTLALGIGANTAIFTVINALLLRPLAYPDSGRLVIVWQDLRARGGPATEWTGPSQHFDWKARTDVFQSLTSIRGWSASVAGGALPESLLGEQATFDYFDVAGTRPALGRAFADADDVPNAPRVVVLSHGLWMRRFGGDRAGVGRAIPINGESHEIIGVMPADFTPRATASRARCSKAGAARWATAAAARAARSSSPSSRSRWSSSSAADCSSVRSSRYSRSISGSTRHRR